MADHVQGIVDVIDAGLQTPVPDPTFGEVSPVNRDCCWRCGAVTAEDSSAGLCGQCRDYLRGEQEQDPVRSSVGQQAEFGILRFVVNNEVLAQIQQVAEAAAVAFSDMAASCQRVCSALEEADSVLVESVAPSLDRLRHRHAAECPRHGPTRGGTCWRCHR